MFLDLSVEENICGYMNMVDIVLINPRFGTSYWGMEHALHMCHVWQAREYAGFSPALACGSDARGAQNHIDR